MTRQCVFRKIFFFSFQDRKKKLKKIFFTSYKMYHLFFHFPLLGTFYFFPIITQST